MSSSIEFTAFLRQSGFKFYTGVPDSVLRGFCGALDLRADIKHLPAANEGAAVGLGIGWHLATGEVPVIYLQNSGLWNALNPFFSLAHRTVYDVPLLFIVGWRGRPGCHDEPQHRSSGAATEAILRMMGITPFTIEKWDACTRALATRYLQEERSACRSSAFLVPLGVFDDHCAPNASTSPTNTVSRDEIMATILEHLSPADFVVGGIGYSGRGLYARRRNNGFGQAEVLRDFLCIGGMGYALQVAIGTVLQRVGPESTGRVWCVEGDGSFLMHLGTAALVGTLQEIPLIYVLLDNGVHASVGGQSTACKALDYGATARVLGFRGVERASSKAEANAALDRLVAQPGPQFLWAQISNEPELRLPRPDETLVDRKRAVMELLKSYPGLQSEQRSERMVL